MRLVVAHQAIATLVVPSMRAEFCGRNRPAIERISAEERGLCQAIR
jgi:hypothetical protein